MTSQVESSLTAQSLAAWLQLEHHLTFTPYQVAVFVTALQAKGFVILMGISGTGKTQLAVKIAALALGQQPDVIPVRPDWRDSRGVLGYFNPISGQYASTELVRQLLDGPPVRQTESEESAVEPRPGNPVGVDWARVRRDVKGQEKWAADMKLIVEKFEGKDPEDLSDDDLREIWIEKKNGITGLGQGGGHPFPKGPRILREATNKLRTGTPGQRLIEAWHHLSSNNGENKGKYCWGHTLRALALFDFAETGPLANVKDVEITLQTLGYMDPKFSLQAAVKSRNSRAIDQAYRFIREAVDKNLSDMDRFERAMAIWHIAHPAKTGKQEPNRVKDSDKAKVDPDLTHRFLILDEMNLARVEYYFAEFLSVMESDRDPEGYSRQPIPLHGQEGSIKDPKGLEIPKGIKLPPYLYIIGTVNTDETTHAFSPKVLDRAFTLEFTDVDLEGNAKAPQGNAGDGIALETALRPELRRCLSLANVEGRKQAHARGNASGVIPRLSSLNELLAPHELHFGYRTRDEIARFVGFALESPLKDGFAEGDRGPGAEDELGLSPTFLGALDAAILMKVLPKFHGPRGQMERPLAQVLLWAKDPEQVITVKMVDDVLDEARKGDDEPVKRLLGAASPKEQGKAVLPRTAAKTARMLHRAQSGFTSFA